jgi:hypothetical protein
VRAMVSPSKFSREEEAYLVCIPVRREGNESVAAVFRRKFPHNTLEEDCIARKWSVLRNQADALNKKHGRGVAAPQAQQVLAPA